MLSKTTIKFINSLNKKKFRQKYNIFVAEGNKICTEILKSSKTKIHSIYAVESWISKNHSKLQNLDAKLTIVSERELKSISFFTTPNQVLILLQKSSTNLNKTLVNNNLSLVLDDIQDPGNLGTIWRIADWFGIEYLFCSPNCVDVYNNKVIQASMGAFLRIPAIETDILVLLQTFPGVPSYGAVIEGDNIYKTNLTNNGFIIIGNESRGINKSILTKIDKKIKIPLNGNAESLNASVATGIICSTFKNFVR